MLIMRLKKQLLIIIIIFIIFFLAYFFYLFNKNYTQACIKHKCFSLELAKTSAEKEKGLMFRTFLPENKGVLFVYQDSGIRSFWMKNTLIPLDIIWIDKNNKIVSIKTAYPCNETCPSINPWKESKYVLEINSGISEKYNFSVGDKVEIN